MSCAACVSCRWLISFFPAICFTNMCYFIFFFSGWEPLLTRTSARTPAVLRRAEAEMGARSGRLHGNGLIWQYQEKAWYFSQIKKQWSGKSKEHLQFNKLSPQVSQENTVKQVAFFHPTCFSTRNELSLSLHQHYPLRTPKTAPFKWEIKS